MKQIGLIAIILLCLSNQLKAKCLDISNFADLEKYSNFEGTDFNWKTPHLIQNIDDLKAIDTVRIENAVGVSAIEFLENTHFDHENSGLYYGRFELHSGKAFDYYVYEAGDNGSGFIFEVYNTSPIAYISDGTGGEIMGCIAE